MILQVGREFATFIATIRYGFARQFRSGHCRSLLGRRTLLGEAPKICERNICWFDCNQHDKLLQKISVTDIYIYIIYTYTFIYQYYIYIYIFFFHFGDSHKLVDVFLGRMIMDNCKIFNFQEEKRRSIHCYPSHRIHGTNGIFTYMCQGLNSHYFHIIGDGHQPNSRGLYTHYKDSY